MAKSMYTLKWIRDICNINRCNVDKTSNPGTPCASRDVCKSGWLKKMPLQERRLSVMTPFTKPPKIEKAWVSFCVHDRTEPWLEFYESRRSNFSHNPPYRTSLLQCLHVSPSIRVHEDHEYVFAITVVGEVIKLGAQNREQMMQWIDALRSKLREMGILTPKDNLYSKEPEGGALRSPLARNPNSPLPPTPIFQFPPHGYDMREDLSSLHSLRIESSPAPSMTWSVASGLSAISSLHSLAPPGSAHLGLSSEHSPSPSVVTYVRHDHESNVNRRHSFRQSLPGSPTTPSSISGGPITFVRSPPAAAMPQTPGNGIKDHVTIINVPSTPNPIFTFDTLSAALESSGGMNRSLLYSPANTSDLNQRGSVMDPNAVTVRIGNSLGAGGMPGMGRPPIPPSLRMGGSTGYSVQQMESEGGTYEPLFMASSESTIPPTTPVGHSTTPNTGLLRRRSEHRRSGRREHNRRSASVGPSISPRQQQYQVGTDGRLMSLREQQVVRLAKEISHQAGVRLTLRKQDCVNAIAFVNCYNQIFVAGWKQREFPYLHNTFHLGDRLLFIDGTHVTTASEAQSKIRNETNPIVEFIIRRVPYGKVFALKREIEGQPLGIIREGNTAEIKEVLQGGLASQHGLTSRASSIDGLSMTSWALTEINHRPLNMFFKHSEISDRLNAVGRDISILVQPIELVKHLKKQLKLIKNYKDYIVM